VDLNDDSNAAEDGEAADAATQKELKRLLDHLHDPVQPGAQYTVLQVCVCVCGGGAPGARLCCASTILVDYWQAVHISLGVCRSFLSICCYKQPAGSCLSKLCCRAWCM
jgi:hypothetical protein